MPHAARTFRIFVSSTFNDLKAERNALQACVYPRLKELCERAGTRFQAIDLRWGVSEEAARDQQTINICLTEVDRCRETSPRPNFIVLLGDRYGWQPPPPQIPAGEFEAIHDHVSEERRPLIEKWYLKDENAVPPEYCLREREGEWKQFEKWDSVERDLASALREGAEAIRLEGDELRKYLASATEQEIERGALTISDSSDHVFCFFRRITNFGDLIADIPAQRVERPTREMPLAEDFVDLVDPESDRRPDTEAAERLRNLKERLRDRLPDNIHQYDARWTGDDVSTDHIGELPETLEGCLELNAAERPPRNICVDVWLRLSSVILSELEELQQVDGLDREVTAHRDFGRDRAKFFIGRRQILDEISDYLRGADPHPLAVSGVSGAGKSALMAKAAERAEERHSHAILVRRFIGATPESSDGRALLTGLCREIARHYGAAETAPVDYRELVEEFPKRLALATSKRPLIVLLDALDQLSDADGARNLIWLPAELPADVRVVVSALRNESEPERASPKGSECLASLSAKLPAGNLLELNPMTTDEGGELLDLWLSEAGRPVRGAEDEDSRRRSPRRLTAGQRAEVLQKFRLEGLPLYLKLAFEEARRWKSYSDAPETELTPGIPGIIRENLFARLVREENHGQVIVSRSLGYLGAAKNGLSEDEVLDVLSSQEEVLRDFKRRQPRSPPVDRLPVVVWSRLYFDLEPYLGERSADGTQLMSFYHRQLGEVVAENFLAGDAGRDRHRELARYFDEQPLVREGEATRAPNLRKLAELPYQQIHAGAYRDLERTLTSIRFAHEKCLAGMTYELAEDHRLAQEAWPSDATSPSPDGHPLLPSLAVPRDVSLFAQFVTTHTHIFARDPDQVIAFGHNYASSGPVVEAADQVIAAGYDAPWIELLDRPQLAHRPACVRTFGPYSSPVTRVALANDSTLAVSGDEAGFIRVWDLLTGRMLREIDSPDGTGIVDLALAAAEMSMIAVTELGNCFRWPSVKNAPSDALSVGRVPTCVALTSNGDWAVIGGADGRVYWCDLRADAIVEYGAHRGAVTAVAISDDGGLVASGGVDEEVRIWDGTGRETARIPGHLFEIRRVATDSAGTVVFFCEGQIPTSYFGRDIDITLAHHNRANVQLVTKTGETLLHDQPHEILLGRAEGRWRLTGLLGSTIYGVALAADGSRGVSVGYDGAICIFDLRRCVLERRIQSDRGCIRSVAVDVRGMVALTGGEDGGVRLWDLDGNDDGDPELPVRRRHSVVFRGSKSLPYTASGKASLLWRNARIRNRIITPALSLLTFAVLVAMDGRLALDWREIATGAFFALFVGFAPFAVAWQARTLRSRSAEALMHAIGDARILGFTPLMMLSPLFHVRNCPRCGQRMCGRRQWFHCESCGFRC